MILSTIILISLVFIEKFSIFVLWKYDSKKSLINPYEVEIKYKTEKKVPNKRKSEGK